VMELRGPEMVNIRRWDGAARACAPWDSLGKVRRDFSFRDGQMLTGASGSRTLDPER
jgi:hypothetical protein